MTRSETLLRELKRAADSTPELLALQARPVLVTSKDLLKFPIALPTGPASLSAQVLNDSVEVRVQGENKKTRQLLRRLLLGSGRLEVTPHEHHTVEEFTPQTASQLIMKRCAAWMQWVASEAGEYEALRCGEAPADSGTVFGFWADKRTNFGDQIGPWLVQEMTGKRMVNSREAPVDHGHMLATVGSVAQWMGTQAQTKRVDVWGTGIMRNPTSAELRGLQTLTEVSVHAVRGRLSREVMMQRLGWDVPGVFGDPGLLCPRYYRPRPTAAIGGEIAFVPHFKHVAHHADNAADLRLRLSDGIHLVDVNRDLRTVIDEIAQAKAVVSSSLHGLVIAQAYGIPWVWLYAPNKNIGGDRFKFDDFFSTLEDPSAVSTYQAQVEDFVSLPFEKIASSASLPKLGIDLDALVSALPVSPAQKPLRPAEPRFRWSRVNTRESLTAFARAAYRKVAAG